MSEVPSIAPTARLSPAVRRGLGFLLARQLPSGQFPVRRTRHDRPGTPSEDDFSPFVTAHVLDALRFIRSAETAEPIRKSVRYLLDEMDGRGLWRYWNKGATQDGHRAHPLIPADLDDMATISVALRDLGVAFPDNRRLFRHNRDRRGCFYTFLLLRPVPTLDPTYWISMLGDWTFARWFLFWRITPVRYRDVSGVVNANVVWYLGEGPDTEAAIDWLIEIVERGEEAACDTFYHDPFTFWHALSRAYAAGSGRLGTVRETVARRIEDCVGATVPAGLPPMHAALAMLALVNFGVESAAIPALAAAIRAMQADDGGWAEHPMYFGTRFARNSWGSRDLTTALCIEALARVDR